MPIKIEISADLYGEEWKYVCSDCGAMLCTGYKLYANYTEFDLSIIPIKCSSCGNELKKEITTYIPIIEQTRKV